MASQRFSFKYGKEQLSLSIENARSIRVLEGAPLPPLPDLGRAFLHGVTDGALGVPLKDRLCPQDKITLVISDITRFWMRQDQIVSLLTAYLTETLGVPHENIAILVALGTHRPMTEAELKTLVTPEVYARFAVFNHDCMADDLVFVGVTARGTEVRVNPLCVGRKVIVISGTVHHLMSGFGGGRKSILPGVSAKRTIVQNHLHCLHETEPRSADTIGMAKLAGNPVHEDMAEAASFVAPIFGISIVSNAEGQHCALCCGDFAAAWEQSCRLVHQNFGLPISRLADVVVVSCGGYPKDLNLYQAVKSLLNAAQALKPGGTMVFLAQCPEGGGAPDFFDWIHALDRGTLDRDLRAAFTIAGYIFYASVEAIDRCQVKMLSEIDPSIAGRMHLEAYTSLDALLQTVDFTDKDVCVMPFGGFTVPYLEGTA